VDGLLIVNKAAGMTSHDVVARVRRILDERSIGHLGTLDPSATGVLPLVIGRFTRLAQFFVDSDKRYEGLIRFGFATDTHDAEGEPAGPPQPVSLTLEQLREAAAKFTGILEQTPPSFSAKKIAGVPAYKLARKKQEVELTPKQVEVKEFEITEWDGQQARFKAWVSSGTYVRSLAHELGQALGPGAHLAELTRTAVREFRLAEAHSLEELEQPRNAPRLSTSDNEYRCQQKFQGVTGSEYSQLGEGESKAGGKAPQMNTILKTLMVHPRLILPEFPAVTAPPEALVRIRHGGSANLPEFGKAPMVRVFEGQARLICLARRVAGTLFQPKVVLL
jgi:tRNA pseudouridine55 synthase